MFCGETLDSKSEYPQAGVIRCIVTGERPNPEGRDLVSISTAEPDQIESTEGLTDVVVLRAQVSES